MSDGREDFAFIHVPFYTGSLGVSWSWVWESIRKSKWRPGLRAIQLAEDLVEKWNACNDSLDMEKMSATWLCFLHIRFPFIRICYEAMLVSNWMGNWKYFQRWEDYCTRRQMHSVNRTKKLKSIKTYCALSQQLSFSCCISNHKSTIIETGTILL